jgi:hypothetical protein
LLFTTVDLSCKIWKFIFSLAAKLATYIPYVLSVATCSKENKRKEKRIKKERKKKVPSTSTCMFNVHSTFICFCTLSSLSWIISTTSYLIFLLIKDWIIDHMYYYCYVHRSNKLQSSCLVLSPSYSRTSMG